MTWPPAPVKVTLDTPDGDIGSGTTLTEYRVDGGPWTPYSAEDEHVLFDGTESTLALWQHDGDGGFERLDPEDETDSRTGGITPTPSRPRHALVPGASSSATSA